MLNKVLTIGILIIVSIPLFTILNKVKDNVIDDLGSEQIVSVLIFSDFNVNNVYEPNTPLNISPYETSYQWMFDNYMYLSDIYVGGVDNWIINSYEVFMIELVNIVEEEEIIIEWSVDKYIMSVNTVDYLMGDGDFFLYYSIPAPPSNNNIVNLVNILPLLSILAVIGSTVYFVYIKKS